MVSVDMVVRRWAGRSRPIARFYRRGGGERRALQRPRGSRWSSSSRVLMLMKASAASSNATSTTRAPVPAVDLALAAREEGDERGMDAAFHDAEHRMRLLARLRDGEVGLPGLQGSAQARHEVRRKEGRVAGHRGHQRAGSVREAALEPRKRPREARDLVGDHAVPVAGVRLGVAVGVDQQLVHLRGEALDHVRHHGLAAERLQSLVDAAHAAALAAGEHEAGDPGARRAHP